MPADSTPVDRVQVDPIRGHIGLVVDRAAQGAFVDLGPVLHWWSYTSLHMTPTQARELGIALIAWADRKS